NPGRRSGSGRRFLPRRQPHARRCYSGAAARQRAAIQLRSCPLSDVGSDRRALPRPAGFCRGRARAATRRRMILPARATLLALLLVLLPHALPASAKMLTANGLTFSDELGGFTLETVSGTGRTDDPIVVVETVTGPQHPVLVIRGLSAAFGNLIGSQHGAGF